MKTTWERIFAFALLVALGIGPGLADDKKIDIGQREYQGSVRVK